MTDDDFFAITHHEGGLWLPASEWQTRAHSILFKDGQTWDEINGFRGKLMDYTPASLKIVQSSWADALSS